ncbi:UDP-glycosyltransferase 88F3 [Artemisia annua]|uniref:UDP-glycosyltransferase 88F3 n=1 Tax=Artemisia annua TaxID=35608 RepID=A0A2U1P9G1_ARTAN|nr:UDP-glycosyltransferase 88F3 [Artemisia annua]
MIRFASTYSTKQTYRMGTIVLYPAPAMGHLISMVELGKLILKHHPSCSIIVLNLTNSHKSGSIVSYISHVTETIPAIKFHHLPKIPLDLESYSSSEAIIFDLIGRSINNVADVLRCIEPTALIIDLFCTSAMSAAANLNIPVYYFITSGACCLVKILYFPTLDRDYPGSFKDMNRLVYSPGMPPIPSADMPGPVLQRNSTDYSDFLQLANLLPKSSGIIVNTFDSLEPKPIRAITDGLCVKDQATPPLYCVGPLLADSYNETHECLNWLDLQPKQSVVYLSFGSECMFSIDQLHEIAKGLEMSGQRFLWVIRSPPTVKRGELFVPPDVVDLNQLLPDGFIERTNDRGFVVKKWAPQVAVLSHESVGGFVTHCGWNSVLEATRAGVPMLAWPLYAEQKLNKIVMVKEMKVALPIDAKDGKVAAEEVEKRVRQLMESEEGNIVREFVKARKDDAARAMSEGGSSRVALAKLVESWQTTRHL